MNKVIIVYGPPGSGKGTQSRLIAERFNMVNFDTGSYIKRLVYKPKNKTDKKIKEQRELMEQGLLTDPAWVLGVVKKGVQEIYKSGSGIVLSGSPRTMFEAFGNGRTKGLIDILIEKYGKKNIHIFELSVSEEESIKRIKSRSICNLCQSPILGEYSKLKTCPFCGSELYKRMDDRVEFIQTRFKEYINRTKPILKELEKRGFKVDHINGSLLPYKVFINIKKRIKQSFDKK